jgi:hypothetical protein
MNEDKKNVTPGHQPQLRDPSWLKKSFLIPDGEIYGTVPEFSASSSNVSASDTKFANILQKKDEVVLGHYEKIFRSPKLLEHAVSFVIGNSFQVVRMAEELQNRDGANLRTAALQNWFVQPETPVNFLACLSENIKNKEDVERIFAEMIEKNAEKISVRLQAAFPHRGEILREAFALHNEERYLASIPLMLTNAEGIAKNVSGKSIFSPGGGWSKGGKPPKIAPWLEKQEMTRLAKIYLSVLQVEHPWSQNSNNGRLSRHLILHGNVIDYGRRIFSLQAISILGFVGWAFSSDGLANPNKKLNTEGSDLESKLFST